MIENQTMCLDFVPNDVGDLRYAVLDNSNPKDVDYFFSQLILLETFKAPALVLRIGTHVIKMPLNWQILIGDPEVGDLEALPLTSINDRGFKAFELNPLSGFRPSFPEIEVLDVYHDVDWCSPKLKSGQYLCVPIENSHKPKCVYFVQDVSRNSEIVDFSQCF